MENQHTDILHLQELLKEEAEKLASYFDLYRSDHVELILDKRTYLGDEHNRICRFCGKDSSEVKFKKDAHAIPEMLGNHYLCTYYECDECNKIFSNLENDLGWFTELGRTITRLKGKKGIPTFKQGDSSIRDTPEQMVIKDPIDNPLVQWVGENNLRITAHLKPFTPMAVYKIFTKMALTLMPEEELIYFKETLEWIREEDHCKRQPPPLLAIYSFIPGPAFKNVGYKLFFRRDGIKRLVPYCQFILKFHNFMYQIYLPFSSKDEEWRHGTDREIKLVGYPPQLDLGLGYPFDSSTELINLSGCEKERGREMSITMEFSSREDVTEIIREQLDSKTP